MDPTSRASFRELLTTLYVPKDDEKCEINELETVRAGSSVLQPHRPNPPHDDVIERAGEDVVLVEDDNYRSIHRIDETPKLVAKKATSAIRIRDEAVKVLRNLQTTPAESIRSERYDYYSQRWFHTTRDSELELVEYVLLHPNHRPHFFTMQCRHLEIEDITRLVLTSLLSEPRENGQCLARFAIKTKTDMPFGVLYSLLETMTMDNDGFQLTDGIVTATLTEARGKKTTTHRLKTTKCKEYGEYESELDDQGRLMASRASIACSVVGKRHVQTQITYINNASGRADSTSRNRFIELEQTVKCMNRRVLIAEEQNTLIEYEIQDEMTPLRMGTPPVIDLIEYLRSGDIDDDCDE